MKKIYIPVVGDSIMHDEQLNMADKIMLWALCLIAWWGSFRLGELLPASLSDFDNFRAVKWNDVKKVSNNQIVIHVRLPKVCKKDGTMTVDLFSFNDKRYDPILALSSLARIKGLDNIDSNDCIFKFSSETPVTSAYINRMLKHWMAPYSNAQTGAFSGHSFRAGLVSHLAENFNEFSQDEILDVGRWSSESWRAYARLKGISVANIMSKIHPRLLNM